LDPKVTYTDLSKNGPHKKHCAWARTPPWREVEIYRFLPIFWVLGAFNTAGKSVSKIGIYALPPLKSEIYAFFIISRPNFDDGFNLSLPRQLTITLKVPGATFLTIAVKQFF
jgi:hypothetical protein